MFQWLRSFARRSRRNLVLESAVGAVMEGMEGRLFLDSCTISGTTINYTGSSSDDNIVINENWEGDTTVENSVGPYSCTLIGGATSITINGGDGNDTIDTSNWDMGATVHGDNGSDTITGTLYPDLLYGDAGNDSIMAQSGADTVIGGTGDDTLDGESGIDWVSYEDRTVSTQAVTINLANGTGGENGTGESDTLSNFENARGGAGADTITGSTTANLLQGGSGNDTIYGGAGNDVIRGQAGNDSLLGENGDDTFLAEDSGDGGDSMYGGSGTDVVDYSTRTLGLTLHVGSNTNNSGQTGASEGDYIADDVENAKGGSAADRIEDNAAGTVNNHFWGNDGNDSIVGGGGFNVLEGGNDADSIYGGDSTDAVFAGPGNDSIWGNAGGDSIYAGDGNDTVYGGADADTIFGEAGDDKIYDGNGSGADGSTDYLDGGSGSEVLGDSVASSDAGDTKLNFEH